MASGGMSIKIPMLGSISRRLILERTKIQHLRDSNARPSEYLRRVSNRLSRPVDEFFLMRANKRRIKKHVSRLPALTPEDQHIVGSLRKDGVYVTTLDKLNISNSDKILKIAQELKEPLKFRTPEGGSHVVDQTDDELLKSPELFLWGLNERLLDIAENYIGVPVWYRSVQLNRSIVDNTENGTRLWHMDLDDNRMIKILIYLNDVDENSGPFQYIDKKTSYGSKKHLGYVCGHVPDEMMRAAANSRSCVSHLGPTGRVIFADTANIFHRGKRPIERERFVLYFTYTSNRPWHPYFREDIPNWELLRLTKSTSERQRRCAFRDPIN